MIITWFNFVQVQGGQISHIMDIGQIIYCVGRSYTSILIYTYRHIGLLRVFDLQIEQMTMFLHLLENGR